MKYIVRKTTIWTKGNLWTKYFKICAEYHFWKKGQTFFDYCLLGKLEIRKLLSRLKN